MKRFFNYCLITLLAAVVFACKEDDTLVERDFFVIDNTDTVTFRAGGGIKYMDVKTNMTFEVVSSESWCLAEINGRGANNLRITVSESPLADARIAEITITGDGKTFRIGVRQDGTPPPPPPPAQKVDERVAALNPTLYYSFENVADLTQPAMGTVALEYSLPASVTLTDGPIGGKRAVTITKENHVKVPNTGEQRVFTMMFDIRVPALGLWYSLLQLSPANSDDGDLFIQREGKLGVSQYSTTTVEAGKWHRIVLVVDVLAGNSVYKVYLDGQHVLTNGSSSVPNKYISGDFWLFTDEDGEENNLDCAGFSYWADENLSDEQIAALGNPYDMALPVTPDERVTALSPGLYYAFTDADDFTKPSVGNLSLEFSAPASVTVAEAGSPAGKRAVTITKENHVKVPNTVEQRVFTMMFDFRVPALGLWYSLLQLSPGNTDDGDLFVQREGKLGVSQYSTEAIEAGRWNRVVLVVDVLAGNSVYKVYLNGQHVLTNGSSSVPNKFISGNFWLFTDEDGEENNLDCAGFAYWPDENLSEEQIAALGSVE